MTLKTNPDDVPSLLRREAVELFHRLRDAAYGGGDRELAAWLETSADPVLALIEARLAKRPRAAVSASFPAVVPPPTYRQGSKHAAGDRVMLTQWPGKYGKGKDTPAWAQAAWTRLLKADVDDSLIRQGLAAIHKTVIDDWGRPALVKDAEKPFRKFWDDDVEPVIEARERALPRTRVPAYRPKREPDHAITLGDDEVKLSGAQWRLLLANTAPEGGYRRMDQVHWTARRNNVLDGDGQLWATNGRSAALLATSKAPAYPISQGTDGSPRSGLRSGEAPDIDRILRDVRRDDAVTITVGPQAARILAAQEGDRRLSLKFGPSSEYKDSLSTFWNTRDPVLVKYGPKQSDWLELPDVEVAGGMMVGFNSGLVAPFARYWPAGFNVSGATYLSPFLVYSDADPSTIGMVMPMRID